MLATEIIQRVREIQIRTGRQVADVLAGQYESVFKGRGMEFDEVRPYVPGDEIRTIDWNVTARMGAPYVKRFVEERQLSLMLMADVSASQEFGSRDKSKRVATAELCALLAFSAAQNDDKVGLALFHGDIEHFVPPRKGQKHALRVVREVLTHESRLANQPSLDRPQQRGGKRASLRPSWWRVGRQATNIAGAVEFLLSVTKRRTVCFVVSDYFDEGFIASLKMANRKHDVIAVRVTDRREFELPNVGLVDMLDPESGETVTFDTSAASFRSSFEERAMAHQQELEAAFRRAKIDFFQIEASESIVTPLARFFQMRERRRR